jgi:hypothetical protein
MMIGGSGGHAKVDVWFPVTVKDEVAVAVTHVQLSVSVGGSLTPGIFVVLESLTAAKTAPFAAALPTGSPSGS